MAKKKATKKAPKKETMLSPTKITGRRTEATLYTGDCIICCDPGLANFGVAVYSIARKKFVYGDTITSEKAQKKQRVLIADDNALRLKQLAVKLKELMVEQPGACRCFVIESFSPPRSAGTAAQIALTFGMLYTLSAVLDIPIVANTPQAIRKTLCGKASATVREISDAVFKKHPELKQFCPTQSNRWEHPVDAAAAFIASRQSDVLKVLLQK